MRVKHGQKMIAPIIVALIVILYYIGIAVFLMTTPVIPTMVRIVLVVIPLILAGVMLGVLVSRIKEIQGGETDDLSQY